MLPACDTARGPRGRRRRRRWFQLGVVPGRSAHRRGQPVAGGFGQHQRAHGRIPPAPPRRSKRSRAMQGAYASCENPHAAILLLQAPFIVVGAGDFCPLKSVPKARQVLACSFSASVLFIWSSSRCSAARSLQPQIHDRPRRPRLRASSAPRDSSRHLVLTRRLPAPSLRSVRAGDQRFTVRR